MYSMYCVQLHAVNLLPGYRLLTYIAVITYVQQTPCAVMCKCTVRTEHVHMTIGHFPLLYIQAAKIFENCKKNSPRFFHAYYPVTCSRQKGKIC
jgi:hypothetical protein